MTAAMSARSCHHPDRFLLGHRAIAALTVAPRPMFRAWVSDAGNLSVMQLETVRDVRQSSRQRNSPMVILLVQEIDAARGACSERLRVELDDAGVDATADTLRKLYDASDGRAGFVSFALPPTAANEARETAAAARRLWYRARRPNVLVQIAATADGIKAVFRLVSEAIGIHVTDIASFEVYRRVTEAYIAGLRHRAERGLPVTGIASFATLDAPAGDRAAEAYGEVFSDAAFGDLRRLGARSQSLLRPPAFDRRLHLRLPARLLGDVGHAGDGGLGADVWFPSDGA